MGNNFKFVMEPNAKLNLLKQDGVGALIQEATEQVKSKTEAASPHASRPLSHDKSHQPAIYSAKVRTNNKGLYTGLVGTTNLASAYDNAKHNSLRKGLG